MPIQITRRRKEGYLLAAELRIGFVDTDERFVARFGSIDAFVGEHGWPAFRAREAEIVADALAPDRVVALGGGATETVGVRGALAAHATVVFLDESPATIRSRLADERAGRPSLTGDDVASEVDRVLASRLPHYRDAADIVVPPGLSTAAQVAHVIDAWSPRCS